MPFSNIKKEEYGFECNLGKTHTSEFFKNVQNCTSKKDEWNLSVFAKLTSAYFSQIAREIMLLVVNNIKGNVREEHTLVFTLRSLSCSSP